MFKVIQCHHFRYQWKARMMRIRIVITSNRYPTVSQISLIIGQIFGVNEGDVCSTHLLGMNS